jgi:2-keto-3-deoxy-L-rhamnonate aldolase
MPTKHSPVPPGIYVPVPTFFGPTKSSGHTPPLALETQCQHAVYLAKAGITGLVLLGSTGEAVALNNDERNEILHGVGKALSSHGFNDYPLIAGTASYTIDETVQQCRDAHTAGMHAVMCLAPGFFANQTTSEGLAKWYEAVADASPLPIMM